MAPQDDRDRRWAAVYAHRERLLRVCRARLGNPHDAEDCVQEAMLRCVEFAGLDEERLGQFLTTVTVRLCADLHRRSASRERLHERLTSFVTVEPGPEESVCDRAESVWLSRRLDTLSPRQRAIVEARAEGLSLGAVAERVAVSYPAVESAMARVRRSMRLALESTFGVVAGPRGWLRARRLLVGALAASAAVVSIGHLPGEFDRPDSPRVVALPPGDGAAGDAKGAAAVGTTTVATTQSFATPPRAAAPKPLRIVGPEVHRQTVADVESPVGKTQVTQSGETWTEMARRCAENGVVLDGFVVRCGHPNDEVLP